MEEAANVKTTSRDLAVHEKPIFMIHGYFSLFLEKQNKDYQGSITMNTDFCNAAKKHQLRTCIISTFYRKSEAPRKRFRRAISMRPEYQLGYGNLTFSKPGGWHRERYGLSEDKSDSNKLYAPK